MNVRARTSIPDVSTRRRTAVTPDGGALPTSTVPPGATVLREASCSCGGGCPSCQAKSHNLKISQPNDPAEIEADRIADRVMQMPVGDGKPVHRSVNSGNAIHRGRETCEDEGESIQRKALPSEGRIPSHTPAHVRSAIGSGGRPLDSPTRSFFESRLGYDLSAVRVHAGSSAAESARAIKAIAYTLGENIVFDSGKYQPESEGGKRLLAHELAHVIQQQTGKVGRMIQKADDASFESSSGVDQGIANGTMVRDSSIMGQTYTVNCGFRSYNFSFRFSKAYKGVYPYRAAGKDVRGVYVKIEASITDRQYCGRCTPMRLIQALRWIQQGASGNVETAEPTSQKRRERAGWGSGTAPSRGWAVDTLDTATTAYTTDLSHTANPGDETTPSILWDVPGHWTTVMNNGKEFYTCAVCSDGSHRNWVAACVQWGYYTDSSGNITFRPSTPSASCGYVQQVRDASERWDTIAGNTPTGITF